MSLKHGSNFYHLKVSVEEAQDTVKLWYNDRQEVRKWQERRKKEAIEDGYVRTLLGRSRRFPRYKSRAQKNHIQRAAINTPVQVFILFVYFIITLIFPFYSPISTLSIDDPHYREVQLMLLCVQCWKYLQINS